MATCVAECEDSKNLFRFFRLTPDAGSEQFPESTVRSLRLRKVDAMARHRLNLAAAAKVWVIERVRRLGGRPAINERITLPADKFPDLDRHVPIPNNVDAFYASRFGLTIGRVTERLKAVRASQPSAAVFGSATNGPLLR